MLLCRIKNKQTKKVTHLFSSTLAARIKKRFFFIPLPIFLCTIGKANSFRIWWMLLKPKCSYISYIFHTHKVVLICHLLIAWQHPIQQTYWMNLPPDLKFFMLLCHSNKMLHHFGTYLDYMQCHVVLLQLFLVHSSCSYKLFVISMFFT